jgi:predicted DNA-binding transcriptional regulator AlpA
MRRIDMSITQQAESSDAPHANDELLTMNEVANVVRVPVATLRYWRHLGSGPRSFRVGRSVRYWRTEVLHWLEQRSYDPQASR